MDTEQLLVIEDDPAIRTLLLATLGRAGFQVAAVESGEEGLRLIEESRPQLVILDLNLPGMNGLDLCRAIRHDPYMAGLPVLMLTGLSEEDDMVAGFEVGADDYITKPFSPKVLTARVNALLRRKPARRPAPVAKPAAGPVLEIKTLGRCELRYAGETLVWSDQFTPTQRLLLTTLLAAPDHRLTLAEVQAGLWPELTAGRSRATFDSLMTRLRRLLEQTLATIDVRQHLALRRGILSLERVQIDACEFLRLTERAGELLERNELWPAELAFAAAFRLWQGPFLPGAFGCDAAGQLQDRLEQQYLDASQQFARLLAETGRINEGLKQLRTAQRYNPIDDSTTRLLHRMLLAQGQPAQARQLLVRHAELLTRHGFGQREIKAIITSFPDSAPAQGWLTP
jgi:two-component system phosphate regulon response regulator PhoB